MALLRSLPEKATLADLRQTYADLLEKLRPYGHLCVPENQILQYW
jgi:hypothetical protein